MIDLRVGVGVKTPILSMLILTWGIEVTSGGRGQNSPKIDQMLHVQFVTNNAFAYTSKISEIQERNFKDA